MTFRGSSWCVILLAFACSGGEPVEPGEQQELTAERAAAEEATVPENTTDIALFGVETRDHQLYFHSTAAGRRYTVKSKDGSVLADRIDADRLGRDYPELLDLVNNGFDARLDATDLMGIGYGGSDR